MEATKKTAEQKALEQFSETMMQHIEAASEKAKKPWFDAKVMMTPTNIVTKRAYNGSNALMLLMLAQARGYTNGWYATQKQIESLNFKPGTREQKTDENGNPLPWVNILKGESGHFVVNRFYKVVHKETGETIEYKDYLDLTEDEQEEYDVYPRKLHQKVWNIDQTNLKESRPALYDLLVNGKREAHSDDESFDAVEAMLEQQGWVCDIKHENGTRCSYYSTTEDAVHINPKGGFQTRMLYYGELVHEMTHSLGAWDRLGRFKAGTPVSEKERAQEELVAEMTAALVMAHYGREKYITEDAAPHLKGWLAELGKGTSFIKQVLEDVRKSSAIIIQHLDGIQTRIDANMQGADRIPPLPTFRLAKMDEAQREEMRRRDIANNFLDVYLLDGGMPSEDIKGETLYAQYNKVDDAIDLGVFDTDTCQFVRRYQLCYNHSATLEQNVFDAFEECRGAA